VSIAGQAHVLSLRALPSLGSGRKTSTSLLVHDKVEMLIPVQTQRSRPGLNWNPGLDKDWIVSGIGQKWIGHVGGHRGILPPPTPGQTRTWLWQPPGGGGGGERNDLHGIGVAAEVPEDDVLGPRVRNGVHLRQAAFQMELERGWGHIECLSGLKSSVGNCGSESG